MIKTKFILGEAGTAKTTTIIDMIDEMNDYVCLALTHSAVKNMINKFTLKGIPKNISNDSSNDVDLKSYLDSHFKTIHSFFRLKFNNNGNEVYQLNQILDIPSYIFIDEISLISLDIINIIYQTILKNIPPNRVITLIMVGDLLQLNPISKHISLINYHNLFDVPNINIGFQESMLIASHLSNNVFSTDYYKQSSKMILTKNYRSNSRVLNILNDVLTDFKKIRKYIINNIELNEYINKGYIVLASKYDHLKLIYQNTDIINRSHCIKTDIGKLKFNNGDELLLTKNLNKDFVNGDKIKVYLKDDTLTFTNTDQNETGEPNIYMSLYNENERYPLLPTNFITIHKAQGLSLDKVLIVLDDMFEITMLYTAITRAVSDVKFVVLNKLDGKKMRLYNRSFNILKTILYNKE